MLEIKDIVIICGAVIGCLTTVAILIVFVWWKFSGEKKARQDVLNSEEYKAMERAASAWKMLYEASQERVGLLEKQHQTNETALNLANARIARLEQQLGIAPPAA